MKKIWVLFLVLAVLPTTVCAQEPAEVRIVTFKGNAVKCLAPVVIRMIDGRLRTLQETGFNIEPGFHTLAGDATSLLGHCPIGQRRSGKHLGFPAVEWLFESGKVYYVALDHHYYLEEDWRLVVWRVETEDGEVVFDITRQDRENYRSGSGI